MALQRYQNRWPWMTFNGHFALKSVSGSATNGLASPARKWRFSVHSVTVFQIFYIHGHMTAFRWYDRQWPWAHFKVIGLFHIEFLKNGVWYGKSYYRQLIGNHTLAFNCPLLMTLKYMWRSFQPRLSFPRPFQQSLACFRVARSPSNSWASCLNPKALSICNQW